MYITVHDIPPDTTEEEVRSLLSRFGHIENIHLNAEGNPQRVDAWVKMDISRVGAHMVAQRIQGMPYKGQTLHSYVPLFTD
ncbi:MAG: RNA-binding protein [Sedimenticola sp.]